MSEPKKFGYVRVSSKDQNEARQVAQMRDLGISDRDIFIDKQSGKDFNRDGYEAMLRCLRQGDEVYFASLDRMGRNYTDIAKQWEHITKEIRADIIVLDMDILDTRRNHDLTGTFISDLVLKILSYVAEMERQKIRARQAEGIAIAKAEGKYTGRKPIQIDPAKFEAAYAHVVDGEWTSRHAMQVLGLKPNTYYRFVKEFQTQTGTWAKK